jgi:GAF domain-containing protein
VQSTPLIDPAGSLLGVISTHFREPHRPSTRELHLMDWFAEYIAAALAQRQNHRTTLFEVNAALQAKTAALHDSAAARINDSALALLANGKETKANAIQDWAGLAVERARRERDRAQALTARVQNTARSRAQLKRHTPA